MQAMQMVCNWNEHNLNPLARNNWRASLVPAAAVIPAPIAYSKVAAVKKLVVGFLVRCPWVAGPLFGAGWVIEGVFLLSHPLASKREPPVCSGVSLSFFLSPYWRERRRGEFVPTILSGKWVIFGVSLGCGNSVSSSLVSSQRHPATFPDLLL